MAEKQLHEQLAACKAALAQYADANNWTKISDVSLEIVWSADTIQNGRELAQRTLEHLAAADETPSQSGVAGDGPISAAASNARIAKLERALRESTNLLLEAKPYQFFVSRSAIAKQVADRIAANERLLGGKHE